ncbi:MAG TPA: 3'(2'),5'-bisphosphate nucleotidase CysQ [Moraxellaceae bacterium]
MASDWSTLLPAVLALAQQAGEDIMAIYRDESRWNVQHKEDDSPLTAADLAANRRIVPGLQELTPDIPVISEECDESHFVDRLSWPRCWLVDPLDGTKEFIARNDEFSINIALVENHEAVLGIVYSPVTGIAYMAARGAGAFREEDGVSTRLRASAFPASAFRVVASRRHRGARDLAFCEIVSRELGSVELALAGSAFKICAVAEGLADAYPRFGPTMEWDTAAGQVVVEEAGGALVDEQGRPFRYNQRNTLRNGSFLVVGDRLPAWMPAWQQAERG